MNRPTSASWPCWSTGVESVLSPSVFWVDLDALDFSPDAPVKKLALGVDMQRVLSGEVSGKFEQAEPFRFQPAD